VSGILDHPGLGALGDEQVRNMKYFSDGSTSPVASPKNGFWVKDGQVFDVTDDSHVAFMINHPYRFNLTIDDITLIYDHYSEEFGSEKQAREDLVRIAASQGWIRVNSCSDLNHLI
jgi:hypothetical protein